MEKSVLNSCPLSEFYMSGEKCRQPSYIIGGLLILYLFYYSYRYILQYNSTVTSPTYEDTPLFFQAAKFAFLFVLVVFLFYSLRNSKIYKKDIVPFVLIVLLMCQSLYSFFVTQNIGDLTFILLLSPGLLIILTNERPNIDILDNICLVFLNFSLIYEIIQITLYLATDRLPALAYDTGVFTDVRFGGPWDDPNGFSVLLLFLIPYAFLKFRSVKRFFYVAVLVLCLAITWSLTGIATFCILLAIFFLKFLIKNKKNALRVIIWISFAVFMFLICGIFLYFFAFDKIVDFFNGKIGSIMGHLDSFDLSKVSALTFVGLVPENRDMESGLMLLIMHGGIFHLIFFYALGVMTVSRCKKILKFCEKTDRNRPMFVGMYSYTIGFLIANINLPMSYMFSNLGIYVLFMAICINYERRLKQRNCLIGNVSV